MSGVYQIYPKKKKSSFSNLNVTTILILTNIIFYILMSSLGFFPQAGGECEDTICKFIALQPLSIFQFPWTFLTSMFMHGSFFHLFINMFILFNLGGMMEKIIGKKRFLWFYLISGFVAGLLFVFLSYLFGNTVLGARIFSSPEIFAVGASGAIFAIAGLFMILTPKLKFMIIFLPFFSLPAYIMIPLVLFGTWLVSSAAKLGIGNTAHLGGLIAGIFYGLYLKKKYPRKIKMLGKYFSR
ncbi:rhomboid family intramembrane serine protease [Candidatus Pacearchaeota archaeon]|nr:rhomboid family intramembrane serine protease [Candidatus Pacearchaeota archaeon]